MNGRKREQHQKDAFKQHEQRSRRISERRRPRTGKTQERERRMRPDRKRLCRYGRDFAVVPAVRPLEDPPRGKR